MTKSKVIDSLIIILFYIGLSCLPFSWFKFSEEVILVFQIIAQFVIFFLIKLVLKKSPLKLKERTPKYKNVAWFLPVFLICFSNIFNLLNPENVLLFKHSIIYYVLIVALSFCVAFNEEFIFRVIIIDNLDESEQTIVKVIISASIFAACHLTHFFSTFDPAQLFRVLYTFGVGIILGLMYIYVQSFGFCVSLHFLFNAINGNLGDCIEYGNFNYVYFLINITVAIVVGGYLVGIYFLKLKYEPIE